MRLPPSPGSAADRTVDRRAFLRGVAGVSVALPWLEATAPRSITAANRPDAFVFVFAPNGKKMDEWRLETPDGAALDRLPYLLEPLAPVRDHLTAFRGLGLDGAHAHGDGPGDHARSAASFLTSAHPRKTGGEDIRAGVSIDQELAARLGDDVPFASLELGMERGRRAGVCDSGYSCAYSNNVAWRTPGSPVAKETDPRAVFERLFGDPNERRDRAAAAERRAAQRSVLDFVRDDAARLQQRLGATDRAKLDDYLTAVREIERRLDALDEAAAAEDEASSAGGVAPPDDFDERLAGGYTERLDLMYELIALALESRTTRVVSFMLGNAGSNRSYRFLGVPEGHHTLSHHGRDPHKLGQIRKINRFHVERFAAFLERLERSQAGGETLLDRSLVVYGSAIADGNRHDHHDLPILLAGRGRGFAAGGVHRRYPRKTPLANLYSSMLVAVGAPPETSFGDATGRLELGA